MPDKESPVQKVPLLGSASVLAAIVLVLGAATSYMLLRLYQTSSILAEFNKKAFFLETRNKRKTLEHYFRKREKELDDLCRSSLFQRYYDAKSIGIQSPRALGVISGQVEQELLVKRLTIVEGEKPVYVRMAFFDIDSTAISARTDFSQKGKWIDTSLFQRLRRKIGEESRIETVCEGSVCRVFLVGPVIFKGKTKGLVLMQLLERTLRDQMQLLALEKKDDFTGLVDQTGTLIVGPDALKGSKIQSLFGITNTDLDRMGRLKDASSLYTDEDRNLMINGGGIPGTPFRLLRVAPLARSVDEQSPLLWILVFGSLMTALVIELVHFFRSSAERQSMFQRLQEAHDTLEVRVKERTVDLQEANRSLRMEIAERKRVEEALRRTGAELEAANRDLKDFAYVVSHDLKAPLRSVRQIIDWLGKDHSDKLDDTGKEYLSLLEGRTKLMHKLVEGILRYSKIGLTHDRTQKVDLNEMVQEIINLIDTKEGTSISIQDSLPTVEFEPALIYQIFQNLLDNALKYMDKPKGEVSVGCVSENGFWKFCVSDNGPGISEEDLETIFELFRTSSGNENQDSTGIGLSIVKKIVELKRGRIWVESEIGRGSTFFFTIPTESREG